MRKQAFLHSRENHQREFQPLGRVQRHQRDLRMLVVLVGIADQSGVVEKLIECLPAVARVHGRIHQFAQVLNARVGLGRVFLFELFDVSRAVNQEFENLGRVRRCSWSAEPVNRLIARLIRRWTVVLVRSIAGSKVKTEVARIEISVGITLCRKRLCGDGRLARPSRAKLGSRLALRLRPRCLLHPLHINPRQHRAPVLNQRAEALQRPQCPRRKQLPRHRFPNRAPH